jgi:hypothetical protein
MYSYDVPLAKHFMPKSLAIFNERFRRVMMMHPDFRSISDHHQKSMWAKNSLYGVALNVAKLESCKTGNDQLKFSLGQLDDNHWKQEFAGVIGKPLKKLTMAASNKVSGLLTKDMIENFERLVRRIGSLIHEGTSFKLLSMILLFSDVNENDLPEIVNLRNQYLSITIRKHNNELFNNCSSNNDLDDVRSVAFGNNLYSRFNSCVCDVKELAMILQKMNNG